MTGPDTPTPSAHPRGAVVTKALLACGVAYGLAYVVVNDIVAAAIYGHYDPIDQAVSELSATGASSRPFLLAMFAVSVPLMVAFGIGVWRSAAGHRVLRVTGALIAVHGVLFLGWVPFPMTARADVVVGADLGANDVGHIAMTLVTLLMVLSEITFGAIALGRRFRVYSVLSAAAFVLFGALTGMEAPHVAQQEPTPWMGLYERIGIGAWMLWLAVLAVVLWQQVSQAMRLERPREVARAA